ncbi:unnamed protein product [Prorocentrum cordatum]|uniref:PARP-type domain-containing protein n=1 Tax=Prorocentrum cordatum TaxID=2364126 RepID=A0ABN9T8D2_9DINO|nr:unnamed protein product [Polarella glacialis]
MPRAVRNGATKRPERVPIGCKSEREREREDSISHLEARGLLIQKADSLAGEAAASYEISEAQMGCYNWARATAHLVRTRIGQAYMEQFEKTKPMTWEEKAEAKSKRKKTLDEKNNYVYLRQHTPHLLQPEGRTWRCARCKESIGKHQRSRQVKWWLQQCKGEGQTQDERQEGAQRNLVLKGKISHHTHVICWSRHKERHFCWSCGATAEKHLSNKMVNSCEGWPAGQASRYALKSLRRKMDWAPGAGDRWSKNTMVKFTKSEQHKSNARDHARDHASSQNDERSVASGPSARRGTVRFHYCKRVVP